MNKKILPSLLFLAIFALSGLNYSKASFEHAHEEVATCQNHHCEHEHHHCAHSTHSHKLGAEKTVVTECAYHPGYALIRGQDTKEATCTERGYVTYYDKCSYPGCERCYNFDGPYYTDLAEHVFGEWNIDYDSTCTEYGSKYRTCVNCGYNDYADIPPKGHFYGNWIVEQPSTCISKGVKYRECSVCHNREYEDIPPTGVHIPGDVQEEIIEATCTNEGVKYLRTYCVFCNALLSEERIVISPKKEHTIDYWYDGYEKDPTTGEETCLKHAYCTVCNEELGVTRGPIPKHKHIYETITENEILPTCTKPGYYDEISRCKICGDVAKITRNITPPNGHYPGESIEIARQEPTHISDGYYVTATYCSVCGEETSRTTYTIVNDYVHSMEEIGTETIIAEPTCEKEGKKETVFKCTECGKVLKKTVEIIPKLEHSYGEIVRENEVEPTCNKDGGYDEVKYCSVCNHMEINHVTIPATGEHKWSAWEVVCEPTCSQAGIEKRVCTLCNEIEYRETKTLEHEFEIVKEPGMNASCGQDGYYYEIKRCKHCGYEESRTSVVIPATEHEFGERTVVQEATCLNDGLLARTCANCGYVEYKDVPAKGEHTPGEPEVVRTEPTCISEGSIVTTTRCKVCGEVIDIKTEVLPIIEEHKPGWTEKNDEIFPTCTTEGSYTLVTHCELCDAIISSEVIKVEPLGHSFSEWTVSKNPTYYEDGEEYRVCSICGEKEIRVIKKLDASDEFKKVVSELSFYDDLDATYSNIKYAYELYATIEEKEKISGFYNDLCTFSKEFFDKTNEFNEQHKASNELMLSSISVNIALPILALLLLKLKRLF